VTILIHEDLASGGKKGHEAEMGLFARGWVVGKMVNCGVMGLWLWFGVWKWLV
jgi:hypothetical protein